jgi:uncharacterized membrane protein
MKASRSMIYWFGICLGAVALPLALFALTHPAGLAGVTQLLTLKRILFFLSLLMTGVVAGLFVGTQLGQLKVQEGLDVGQFAFFKQRFELAVGGVMPAVMILTTLSPAPLLVLLRRGPTASLVLVAVAMALWIAATVVTVVLNVPVNSLAAKWDPTHPPANWEQLRDSWHLGQTLRTALTVPAFASLLLAAIVDDR